MKILAFLSFLMFGFMIQYTQEQVIRTLFYDDILYGKVKQTITANFSHGIGVAEFTDTTKYDEKGNTLESDRKTMRGSVLKEKYIDKSDASGKKMQIINSQRDQNIIAKFDAKGNLVEYSSHYTNGTIAFLSYYEYDDQHNLKNFSAFGPNNNLTLKKTYKYDNHDKLIGEEHWNSAGKLDFEIIFKYEGIDKFGNWTRRTSQKKLSNGQMANDVRVERQIIYY